MHSVANANIINSGPYLEVEGISCLSGNIKISGAKNSVLVLMAASLLTEEKLVINNVPELTDIAVMSDLLKEIGVNINRETNQLSLSSSSIKTTELPYNLVHALRASFVCIGPLLARKGEVKIPMPGGCRIGARPIDEHIKGLKAMGAEVIIKDGVVCAQIISQKKRLQGAHINLNCQSVGATEALLMAATLAEGETIIENAAQEPEVQDLANLLISMGAQIFGAGSSKIKIIGKQKLNGSIYSAIPDRIEAGTFLIAAAITRSELSLFPVIPDHLNAIIEKLEECGCSIHIKENSIKIIPAKELKSVDISTSPFPGFPTDLQAPFMALMATANGTSRITENVFENRMQHVAELKRMGSSIHLSGNTALIEGVKELIPSCLSAGDLRSSAAIVLASISAKGKSIIKGLHHLDRGYEKFEEKLNKVGCNIVRKGSKIYQSETMQKGIEDFTDLNQEVA